MFERPMKDGPATVVSVFAAIAALWGFYFLGRVLSFGPDSGAGFMMLVLVTAVASAGAAMYVAYFWARDTPKWKLVRDRLDQANGGY